jgi:hypothetical protein
VTAARYFRQTPVRRYDHFPYPVTTTTKPAND